MPTMQKVASFFQGPSVIFFLIMFLINRIFSFGDGGGGVHFA
jgi:hypothetical protein